METKALIPLSLQDTLSLGEVLSKSGFFNDARQASQAVVKVLAGRELGFGPIASMTGIHIVKGKPSIGANLLGAAVKGSGRYNYRVIELTNERAELVFYEGDQEVGRSVFTMEDAGRAKLNGDNWQNYPRNMLFARALSNGARWYCPDVFSGVTPYTPEELGAEVDGETGEVIDVTPTPWPAETFQAGEEKPESPPTNGNRPYDAETLRAKMRELANWQADQRYTDGEPITEGQLKAIPALIAKALSVSADLADKARHQLLEYLFGVDSTSRLMKAEASAIITAWKHATEGNWDLNRYAKAEAARVIEACAIAAGQQAMDL